MSSEESTVRIFRESALEVVIGLILIVAGVYVTSATEGDALHVAGNVLVALGSLLASYRAAEAYARRRAREELRDSLGLFNEQLRATAAQLIDTVGEARAGTLEPVTCYALMLQSSQSLIALVSQMKTTFDIATDPSEVAAAREELMRLVSDFRASASEARSLASQGGRTEEAERFASLETKATEVEVALTAERVPVEVNCPHCGHEMATSVGMEAGSSALPRCGHCRKPFHVHRKADGTVITRVPGSTFPALVRAREREATRTADVQRREDDGT